MTREVREWWEATADAFQSEIDLDVGVNWTGFDAGGLDLLGDVSGDAVLELGCGGGQCAVAVAKQGASVTGIDLSIAQLAHARSLADEHDVDIHLLQGDVTDLSALSADSFDVAFNAYVFQWVGDLADCFTDTHRVLRPDGRFVFSMPHPVYDLADPESMQIEDSYFDTGRQATSYDGMDIEQVTYRHRVSDVVNALIDTGFQIDGLYEPGSADPADYEPGPWGERTPELMSKLPATLAIEARAR